MKLVFLNDKAISNNPWFLEYGINLARTLYINRAGADTDVVYLFGQNNVVYGKYKEQGNLHVSSFSDLVSIIEREDKRATIAYSDLKDFIAAKSVLHKRPGWRLEGMLDIDELYIVHCYTKPLPDYGGE